MNRYGEKSIGEKPLDQQPPQPGEPFHTRGINSVHPSRKPRVSTLEYDATVSNVTVHPSEIHPTKRAGVKPPSPRKRYATRPGNSPLITYNNGSNGLHDSEDFHQAAPGARLTPVLPGNRGAISDKLGHFCATANVMVADGVSQRLFISFNLQIKQERRAGDIDYRIEIDELIISASEVTNHTLHTNWKRCFAPDHQFLIEEIWLTVYPSAEGWVTEPRSVYPGQLGDFIRCSETKSQLSEFGVGCVGGLPMPTFKFGLSKSKQKEAVIPAAAAVMPISIGSGPLPQAFQWRYRAAASDPLIQTRIELSRRTSAEHRLNYTSDSNSLTPSPFESFNVKIRTVFRSKTWGLGSLLASKLQLPIPYPQMRKLNLTLSVEVKSEGHENMEFPTQTKRGSSPQIDVDVPKGVYNRRECIEDCVLTRLTSDKDGLPPYVSIRV